LRRGLEIVLFGRGEDGVKDVKCRRVTELKSVISLLEYIDPEIGSIDQLAQELIRVGADILRDRAKIYAQAAENQNGAEPCRAGQGADLVKLAG
jgi:hypothetical protein